MCGVLEILWIGLGDRVMCWVFGLFERVGAWFGVIFILFLSRLFIFFFGSGFFVCKIKIIEKIVSKGFFEFWYFVGFDMILFLGVMRCS